MSSTKTTLSEIVRSPEIRKIVEESVAERLHMPFYDSLIRNPDHEFSKKLEAMFPDTATGDALNQLASVSCGLSRMPSETDKQFRSRINDYVGIDEDEQFARKIETAVQEWDAEKES